MKQYKFKNFTNNKEALETLNEVEAEMPGILEGPLEQWNSLKVVHDEPEVWRLWMQCGEIRLPLHLISPSSDPFFHFHPWPSVVKCVNGGYLHRMSFYPNAEMMTNPLHYNGDDEYFERMARYVQEKMPITMTRVVPGSIYMMTDIRQCHQVIVPEGSVWNSSVMIMGKPYFSGASELFSRKKLGNNPVLTEEEKIKVINPVRKSYGLSEW